MKQAGWKIVLRLLVIIALATMAFDVQVVLADDEDYVAGEVVVKLNQTSDLAGIAAAFQLDPTPLDQFGARAIYRLRILDSATPQAKAAALQGDQRVQYAEPNFLEQTPEGRQRYRWSRGGSSGEYAEQWAGAKIRLPEAHTVTQGAGVIVAVLDTGIDLHHPALTSRLVGGYDFVNMDTNPSEEGSEQNLAYGHGTHVAGLVALAAPAAKIMPVRVLDPDGVGNIWVLAEALAYAVNPDGNPATDDGADVINLSLSTTRETHLLEELVRAVVCPGEGDDDDEHNDDGQQAGVQPFDDDDDDDDDNDENTCLTPPSSRGAVVVAAAGNSAASTPEYPAGEAIGGLLAVAATTEADVLADFSNYGSWVQVAAPGARMLSSIPGGEYGVWNGTSMSAPLVAGQAALVRALYPDFDAAGIAGHIVSTATDIKGAVPRRVDAARAVGVKPAATNGTNLLFLPITQFQ